MLAIKINNPEIEKNLENTQKNKKEAYKMF